MLGIGFGTCQSRLPTQTQAIDILVRGFDLEFRSRSWSVQFADGAGNDPDVAHFPGRGSVGVAMVAVCMFDVGKQNFGDGDTVRIGDTDRRRRGEFELQPGESRAGFQRIERTGQQLKVQSSRGIRPHGAGAAGC